MWQMRLLEPVREKVQGAALNYLVVGQSQELLVVLSDDIGADLVQSDGLDDLIQQKDISEVFVNNYGLVSLFI